MTRIEGQIEGVVADADDLAIANYDDLTAAKINAQLPGLSQLELAKVGSYERRHQDRKTVIKRIEALTGDEPWPGYDELTVSDIESVLSEGDLDRTKRVRIYEAAHKKRDGVLQAADRS